MKATPIVVRLGNDAISTRLRPRTVWVTAATGCAVAAVMVVTIAAGSGQ